MNEPGPKAVRQELKNIIAFWYGKGVDGFRVDMANSLVKNDKDKSAILDLWREVREWSDKNYPDHVLVAEGLPEILPCIRIQCGYGPEQHQGT